jgi:hypothetical protein
MRLETIVYECDWCKDRLPARYPGAHDEDEPPEGWKEIEYSMMCPDCQKARADAIGEVRHQRLNKDRVLLTGCPDGTGPRQGDPR